MSDLVKSYLVLAGILSLISFVSYLVLRNKILTSKLNESEFQNEKLNTITNVHALSNSKLRAELKSDVDSDGSKPSA